jgi:hypothetical protein
MQMQLKLVIVQEFKPLKELRFLLKELKSPLKENNFQK